MKTHIIKHDDIDRLYEIYERWLEPVDEHGYGRPKIEVACTSLVRDISWDNEWVLLITYNTK